jgi:glycosyltransferase involved in cell wall biosynthesis
MPMVSTKPRILVFVLNYLPGYKSGGVLKTLANTVAWLGDDFEFWIVTRDRDLGSEQPYSDVPVDQWLPVGGAMVRYLAPSGISSASLAELIAATPHELIHLNSYFDPVFTLRIMLARKMGKIARTPLLLSPRGEFGDGSLKLKYAKKLVFIQAAKLLRLFDDVIWHATSKHELQDIAKVVKPNTTRVRMALDLPAKAIPDSPRQAATAAPALKVVFLSRISREKNLDFALRILQRVKAEVIFDIYGPDEDVVYWRECQQLLAKLPANIKASYHGSVAPDDVAAVFAGYDLFFFPSKGENYGHVIAESISVGTKILISKDTPWLELEKDGLGWDVDLRSEAVFVELIESLARKSHADRLRERGAVRDGALKRLFDPRVLEDNRQLFRAAD